MSTATGLPSHPPTTTPNIETTDIQTAPGVTLTNQQQTLIGSILDLFSGRPSLPKLALWQDDATFTDPLTIATGRDKYAAQWYGLQQAFKEIEREKHLVTDAGNPIQMELRQRYVAKGLPGKTGETTIDSVVKIWVGADGKVERVEDRWNGKLPEGTIANAFRHLNAVTVPKVVSVPKNEEEDAKKGNI